MRLSEFEQKIIKETILALDQNAKIILFGSRVDDAARGGDIDLLVISEHIKRHQLGKIRWQLWEQLGEQKIDLVLSDRQLSDAFVQVAVEQGVVL